MRNKFLQPGVFPHDPSNPTVHIAGASGPYENTAQALSKFDLSKAKGKKVLLKPNIGRAALPNSGITTNPQVIAAAIDMFTENGAAVAIGESPITGVNMIEAFEASGVSKIANERNCKLIDMDAGKPECIDIKNGIAIKSLRVCPEVFEHDIIVSIPVMKTHMHTVVTLSVKNMKGCLWRRSKVDLHMLAPAKKSDEKPLNIAIADMSSILRPHLAIIDGSIGMEGLGPSAGAAKKVGVVLAGIDPYAADAAACALMGINPESVPHLRIGARLGYGIIDLSKIKITPDTWRDFISPFELPPENLSIEFPGITVLDEQSCSACQSTVLMFLKRYGNKVFDYFPDENNINMVIGKGHKSVPHGSLCIGNCAARHKKRGIFISGCPPVVSQIHEAISGSAEDE